VELRAGIATDQAVNQTGHDVESRNVGPWLSLATLTEIDIPPDTSFYSVRLFCIESKLMCDCDPCNTSFVVKAVLDRASRFSAGPPLNISNKVTRLKKSACASLWFAMNELCFSFVLQWILHR